MDNIILRNAKEADLPAILSIYNEVIINTTAVYSDEPHTLQMRREWYLDRVNNNFPVLVAVSGDTVAGFCSFGHFRIWPCYRFTAELSLYVDCNYRGRGVSKIMLQALIERATQMNIHALLAGISADNHISLNLHHTFGFEEVAHFKEVGFKFGRWLDLKFLELILSGLPSSS